VVRSTAEPLPGRKCSAAALDLRAQLFSEEQSHPQSQAKRSEAKPSQAKQSEAKPSQAKRSQAKPSHPQIAQMKTEQRQIKAD